MFDIKEYPGTTFYVPFIAGLFSMIAGSIVLISYYAFKDIKIGSNQYMKTICSLEMLIVFFTFLSNFYSNEIVDWPVNYFLVEKDGDFCVALSYLHIYAYLIYMTMNIFFCNYIYRILKKPQSEIHLFKELIISLVHGFVCLFIIYELGEFGYMHRIGLCTAMYIDSIALNLYLSILLPFLTIGSFIRTMHKLNKMRKNNAEDYDIKTKSLFFYINLSYLFVFFMMIFINSLANIIYWINGDDGTGSIGISFIYIYICASNPLFLSLIRMNDPIVKSFIQNALNHETTFTNEFSYESMLDDSKEENIKIDYTNRVRVTSDDSFLRSIVVDSTMGTKVRQSSDCTNKSKFFETPTNDTMREQPEFLFYQKYISKLILKAETKNNELFKGTRDSWHMSDFIKFEKYDYLTKEGEILSLLSYSTKFFYFSKIHFHISPFVIADSFGSTEEFVVDPQTNILYTQDLKFSLQVVKKYTKVKLINNFLMDYHRHLITEGKHKTFLPKLVGLYSITFPGDKCISILVSKSDLIEESCDILDTQLLHLKKFDKISIQFKRGESLANNQLYILTHTLPKKQKNRIRATILRDFQFLIYQNIFTFKLDLVSILEQGYSKEEFKETSNYDIVDFEKGFKQYMKKTSPLRLKIIFSQLFDFYGLSPAPATLDQLKTLPEEYYLNSMLDCLKKYLD